MGVIVPQLARGSFHAIHAQTCHIIPFSLPSVASCIKTNPHNRIHVQGVNLLAVELTKHQVRLRLELIGQRAELRHKLSEITIMKTNTRTGTRKAMCWTGKT